MDTTRDTTPRDDRTTTPADAGVQAVLPLDLDPDEPVPFRLTPKARRAVAPHTLPTLEVVEPPTAPTGPVRDPSSEDEDDDPVEVPHDLDDPHDPRSARARALRRGGMAVRDIARRLDVDELAVRTWTGDLDLRGRRRPRLRAVAEPPRRRPRSRPSPSTTGWHATTRRSPAPGARPPTTPRPGSWTRRSSGAWR